MRTLLPTIALAAVLAIFAAVQLPAQTTDPVVGTWELNIAKSKFNPGPAPKSETRTYVVVGQEIKGSSKGIDADDKPTSAEWTVNYDGMERPVSGSPDLDALSLKRIDTFTTESTQKKAGKVVATATRVVAKDGKTMTITTKGTNAKGQAVNNVEVFEKR